MLIRNTGRPRARRTGTVLVESAFVYPVLFILLMMIVLGGMAAFRYQLVAQVTWSAALGVRVCGRFVAAPVSHECEMEYEYFALTTRNCLNIVGFK